MVTSPRSKCLALMSSRIHPFWSSHSHLLWLLTILGILWMFGLSCNHSMSGFFSILWWNLSIVNISYNLNQSCWTFKLSLPFVLWSHSSRNSETSEFIVGWCYTKFMYSWSDIERFWFGRTLRAICKFVACNVFALVTVWPTIAPGIVESSEGEMAARRNIKVLLQAFSDSLSDILVS